MGMFSQKNVFTNHKLLQYESHHGQNFQSGHQMSPKRLQSGHDVANMYIAQDFHIKQLE
jgi:hypothetical protein